jgi:uncharacterized protein
MWDDIALYIAIGFAAQLVDGAIGMAYGVMSSSILMSMGVSPAVASACVHMAETFTTGISGFSHWKFGNVDFALVRRLAIPGAIGGALGAYILTNIDGNIVKPYVAGYLLVMGLYILWKARAVEAESSEPVKNVSLLGLFGGFVDSIGGGGWGPIVTTTLIGRGTIPRYAIGSVNLSEFFVTLAISATFILTIGLELWPIIVGLVVGGALAAPLAAYATRYLPARVLMVIVGCVIVTLSLRTLIKALM